MKKKGDKETARRLLFMLSGARDDTIYALEARALAAWVLGDREQMDAAEVILNRMCDNKSPLCHLARALVERYIAEVNIGQAELALNHVEQGLSSTKRLLRHPEDVPEDYLRRAGLDAGGMARELREAEARYLLLRSTLLPEIGFDKAVEADENAAAAADEFAGLGLIEEAVKSKLWRFRLGAARGSINYELIEDALSQSRGTGAFRLAAANYLGARAVAGLGSAPELVEEVKAEAKLSAPTLGLMALFGAVDAGEFRRELERYREEFMPPFVAPAIAVLRKRVGVEEAMAKCGDASPDEETCREYVKQAEEGIVGEEQLLYVAFMQDPIGSLSYVMDECLAGGLDMGREYIMYWASPNTNSAIKWRLYSDLLEKAEGGCGIDAKKAVSKIFFYLV